MQVAADPVSASHGGAPSRGFAAKSRSSVPAYVELTDDELDELTQVLNEVKGRVEGVAGGLDELEVSFGIELKAESGPLTKWLINLGGKGSLTVKMVWKKNQKSGEVPF
jgi:hypothetical protein